MGNFYQKKNIIKENYFEIRKNNEKQLTNLYQDLNNLKSRNDLARLDDLILTYEKIFEYDNTKEKDVLDYLLLLLKKLKDGKIDIKFMKEKLDLFNIFISDANYIVYFKEYERVNSITKLNNLIEILKSDLTNDKYYIKRKAFIDKIYELKEKCQTFYSSNIKFTRAITWENKEFYLFNIYMNFLETLVNKIEYHKICFSTLALESQVYVEKKKDFVEKKDDETFKELQLLKIYEGEFMKIYIRNFQTFLKKVDTNYKIRFLNDTNYLNKDEDRNLFEDYFQFLVSYNFKGNNTQAIINFWNEVFIPLTNEEKLQIIEKINYDNNNSNNYIKNIDKLTFELIENKLLVKQNGELLIIIEKINYYVFENLVNDLNINNNSIDFDYYKYKNLKPNYYITELFILRNKNSWKELSINILSSKALKEAQENLFDSSYIDILSDKLFLSEIFDNIKFFIYETNFIASSNKNSLKIYEYGLYKIYPNIENKDLSLLIFYSFNNISNIHEIGGHISIMIQNQHN